MKFTKEGDEIEENFTQKIIKPITIKRNPNSNKEPFNYFFINDLNNLAENISEEEIELLKEKNKWFFFEYIKLKEKNNILKLKLQELSAQKDEFHKYLIKLEQKEKYENVNNREVVHDNNLVDQEAVHFNSNIYIHRKRKRRKKTQIVYKYKCDYNGCDKKYATKVALNQHLKLKHF